MTQLPFLVVHGALFWKLVLAGLVVVSCGVPLWRLKRHGRFRLRQLVLVPVAGVVWYGLLWYAGTIALDHAGESSAPLDPRLVIAAGLPGSRTAALERLKSSRVPNDDDGLQLGLALDRFYGRCSDARLYNAARFEAALPYAQLCGAPLHETEILVALGRYADAAALVDLELEPGRAAKVMIGAGRWREAAMAVARARPRDKVHDCFARLLAGWGGDREAVRSIASERGPDDCGMIGAIARGEQLAQTDRRAVLTALVPLVAPSVKHAEAVDLLSHPKPELWLAPFTGDHETNAVVELVRGRFATARAELTTAGSTERELAAAIALRDGTALPPLASPLDDFTERAERARRGIVDPFDEIDDGGQPAFIAAFGGDGGPLAELLRESVSLWSLRHQEVLGVVSHVVVNRDALAEALRSFRAERASWNIDPFDELISDAFYRDTAQLIGDAGDAARWQTIIDRHATMLADRHRAIAMVIWQRLAR